MNTVFLDSSVVAKLYHTEVGTARAEALVQDPVNECVISPLSIVEICSVFALKVRTGAIHRSALSQLQGRFFSDLSSGRFKVVVLESAHAREAQNLILKCGLSHGLRTLDALQLAIANHLRQTVHVGAFVASDARLCAAAEAEGFTVLNPVAATP